MDKKELKKQVDDLNGILLKYADTHPLSVSTIIKFAKMEPIFRRKLEGLESTREIKRRKLTNEYIRKFHPFDIHEALEIDIKEARRKLRDFDFTTKEKNIICDNFSGGAKSFLNRYDGEVSN